MSRMVLLLAAIAVTGCGVEEPEETDDAVAGDVEDADEEVQERVGFEILHIEAPDRIVTWLSQGAMSTAEFEALELASGWIKNQPREGLPDGGVFARSPDAEEDGLFRDESLFGHPWRHVATIVETNVPLPGDPEGLLRGNTIHKFHSVFYGADRALPVLVSPDGEAYVLVSRDAGRTQEEPTIPGAWTLTGITTTKGLDIPLPTPTLNIRTDNEDSFQGPVAADLLGLEGGGR